MLFDQPENLEPDDVLDWHALCNAGLDRERSNVRQCLLNQSPVPTYLSDALHAATSELVELALLVLQGGIGSGRCSDIDSCGRSSN